MEQMAASVDATTKAASAQLDWYLQLPGHTQEWEDMDWRSSCGMVPRIDLSEDEFIPHECDYLCLPRVNWHTGTLTGEVRHYYETFEIGSADHEDVVAERAEFWPRVLLLTAFCILFTGVLLLIDH